MLVCVVYRVMLHGLFVCGSFVFVCLCDLFNVFFLGVTYCVVVYGLFLCCLCVFCVCACVFCVWLIVRCYMSW